MKPTRPASESNVVVRSGGRRLRRTTVYFDTKTYDRLRRFCFDHGLGLSDVAEAAVGLHLDVRQGARR